MSKLAPNEMLDQAWSALATHWGVSEDRRKATATLLRNQHESGVAEEAHSDPATSLTALVVNRLIAFDLVDVQPLSGEIGEISFERRTFLEPENDIPVLDIRTEHALVTAIRRDLRSRFSRHCVAVLEERMGAAAGADVLRHFAAGIAMEIDKEILGVLFRTAFDGEIPVERIPSMYSGSQASETLLALVKAMNGIYTRTRRAPANRLVAGAELANAIGAIGAPLFVPAAMIGSPGPYLFGYLTGIPVYVDPFADEYRGAALVFGPNRSAAVYSPYILCSGIDPLELDRPNPPDPDVFRTMSVLTITDLDVIVPLELETIGTCSKGR